MSNKLELDVRALAAALRSSPASSGQGIWDPLRTTLTGDSYVRVDDACVLGILGLRVLRPFSSLIIRGDYITLQYLQFSGNFYHHYNGQTQQVRSGSLSLTAAAASTMEIRQLRPASST